VQVSLLLIKWPKCTDSQFWFRRCRLTAVWQEKKDRCYLSLWHEPLLLQTDRLVAVWRTDRQTDRWAIASTKISRGNNDSGRKKYRMCRLFASLCFVSCWKVAPTVECRRIYSTIQHRRDQWHVAGCSCVLGYLVRSSLESSCLIWWTPLNFGRRSQRPSG